MLFLDKMKRIIILTGTLEISQNPQDLCYESIINLSAIVANKLAAADPINCAAELVKYFCRTDRKTNDICFNQHKSSH